MRFLGIDYGNKRIGISVSDESNSIANPYTTIINKDFKTVVS
ncbi:MAG: RuvX/YqgF family protein, partial [Candidatus Pacebacteria bacterium]|nr:RuvX/YqgF family protein [Candidatus Paceibacterota bacterium]